MENAKPTADCCGICFCWLRPKSEMAEKGLCRRFPNHVRRKESDWCGEFTAQPPSAELLDLVIAEMPIVTQKTIKICNHLKLRTIGDLLLVGKRGITADGTVNVLAVRELAAALKRIGVEW